MQPDRKHLLKNILEKNLREIVVGKKRIPISRMILHSLPANRKLSKPSKRKRDTQEACKVKRKKPNKIAKQEKTNKFECNNEVNMNEEDERELDEYVEKIINSIRENNIDLEDIQSEIEADDQMMNDETETFRRENFLLKQEVEEKDREIKILKKERDEM